jgi:hypothetical protein
MNLTSGIFTAPRPGIYFFSFTGLADFPAKTSSVYFEANLHVYLYLNGGRIGSGRVLDEGSPVAVKYSPLSTLQSTLNLKKGDQVWLEIFDLTLTENNNLMGNDYTHFMGFMLEEEIVASL